MDPHEFVGEVYRRMRMRNPPETVEIPVETFLNYKIEKANIQLYSKLLPEDRNASIIDIGPGDGWFLSMCHHMGYRNLAAADFAVTRKFSKICRSVPIRVIDIESNIGETIGKGVEHYEFVHMSHVIEHIPKYSLLYVVDGVYKALVKNGTLVVRTPNMEGPCALSAYYVTLAHEYGFASSNLQSLLSICGFDDIVVHPRYLGPETIKQYFGSILRSFYRLTNKNRHRLFGVNAGGEFGAELIVSAKKGDALELFDERFR